MGSISSASRALAELERLKTRYGEQAAGRRLELLRVLSRRPLGRADRVLALHELLCFARAYPDDAEVLARVERMLRGFERRADLRRFRRALSGTGVAGTEIEFSFFAENAGYLARRWGRWLSIDWEALEQSEPLDRLLPLLALWGETPALDELPLSTQEWLQQLKGPGETDAGFLLRRLEQLGLDGFARELLYEGLDLPLRLEPGPDTPARTREKLPGVRPVFQTADLRRTRPRVPDDVLGSGFLVRHLPRARGRRLRDLCRDAMITRARDLDAFAYGNPGDVHLVDCGAGLQLAFVGLAPQRRLMLETLYGYLMLKNGVPVGYGAATALFGSCEIAYTVFDTFRSAEAASIYGQVLAATRQLLGVDSYFVEPYQIGQDNEDAIASGAWWFYQKLGFRPRDPALLRLMRAELARMRSRPGHRSSPATLRRLASDNVYLHLGPERDDVLGLLPLPNVGLELTRYLARRFGADRRRAERTCPAEAARLLGQQVPRGLSAGQRLALQRWSPLLLILPGVQRWSADHRQALWQVALAKGGSSELDYLRRFDAHRPLRDALRRLARG
jgi:hypothetical protein